MFKQIVVGVDGKEGGRDAIALATNLLAGGGELTFGHIYTDDPAIYRGASIAYAASQRRGARELLEATRAGTGVHAHLRCAGSPSVGHGLHGLCDAVRADLLVVGSSRRALFGRVLLGDDTQGALDGAPCAIAIAPAGYEDESRTIRQIGVGYDGSPESVEALRVARTLAAEHGARVSAFEAVSLPIRGFGPGPLPLSDVISARVVEARERVAALGLESHAAYGPPGDELSVYSASLDLLIVGSRGYGPLGRLMHGSTSRHLARTARCPLLVLPRTAQAAGSDDRDGGDTVVAGLRDRA